MHRLDRYFAEKILVTLVTSSSESRGGSALAKRRDPELRSPHSTSDNNIRSVRVVPKGNYAHSENRSSHFARSRFLSRSRGIDLQPTSLVSQPAYPVRSSSSLSHADSTWIRHCYQQYFPLSTIISILGQTMVACPCLLRPSQWITDGPGLLIYL